MHTDPECCEVFKGDKLPERQLRRLLSVRAYDEGDMTRGTEIVRDDGDGMVFERVVSVSFSFRAEANLLFLGSCWLSADMRTGDVEGRAGKVGWSV